jgi:glycosyltransferase involved in cell wall biosynthesis
MQKLNIVIISRTIHPLLSPRAFRATELAKELAKRGHSVTLYAVLGKFNYSDFQKDTGIVVKNIGKMWFATDDSEGNFRYTLLDKIMFHSLHRFFEFPDIEFTLRIPSIILREKNCNMLITNAVPYSIHWGAALAKTIFRKEKFPEKWVSDCGDPYMKNPFDKKKFFYFKYVEKWWGRKTDIITVPLFELKENYYSECQSKIKVIPQGFDFENIRLDKTFIKNEIPTFAYAGTIYPGHRDPTTFLNYLSVLDCEFKFTVFTNDEKFYLPFKEKLKQKLDIRNFVPREQLLFELSRMDFLINFRNRSANLASGNKNNIQELGSSMKQNDYGLPSKLIDYLLTKRPILDISKDFSEFELFHEFLTGDYENQNKRPDINQFDIRNVTDKFLNLYFETKML